MADQATLDQNVATVKRLYSQVLVGKNLDILPEIVSSEIVIHTPATAGGEMSGLEAYESVLRDTNAAFPDMQVDHLDVFPGEDHVAIRNRYSGTHKGKYMGVPPTGKSVTYEGIVMFKLADGKITEAWGQIDTLDLMTQLGAVDPPEM